MQDVSELLNEESSRVEPISDWYTATAFREWLLEQGETEETMGRHGGLVDIATLRVVAPQHVRTDGMSIGKGMDVDGVTGDPNRATTQIGRRGMDFSFAAALDQIQQLPGDDQRHLP